eukprot:1335069-Amorphochlora_amoeboformis.AAC.1
MLWAHEGALGSDWAPWFPRWFGKARAGAARPRSKIAFSKSCGAGACTETCAGCGHVCTPPGRSRSCTTTRERDD